MIGASNSSRTDVPLSQRCKEWSSHFMMRVQGLFSPSDFGSLFAEIDEYRTKLARFSGVDLERCRILEIGFGQRPNRLVALTSMGLDVRGVDVDQPVLSGSLQEFLSIYRNNGSQRAFKSFVRHYLFDWHEKRGLARALARRGSEYRLDRSRFIVSNVAAPELGALIEAGSLDLIFSEDAFEHIAVEDLRIAIASMRRWLKPTGLALVRFTLYTGITGGHLVEWYPHTLDQPMDRRSEPWEHLRQKRFVANTYLNRLRLHEYRRLLQADFSILEQVAANPDLGQRFLTPDIRAELGEYSDEELLSNEVLFVLKPRAVA